MVVTPTRYYSRVTRSLSPVRVVRTTTTRVITTPERLSSYTSYLSPTTRTYSYLSPYVSPIYLPSSYYYPSSYIPSSYLYPTLPSYRYTPISRLYTRSLSPIRVTASPTRYGPSYLRRNLPRYGSRALDNYVSTEPYNVSSPKTYKAYSLPQMQANRKTKPIFDINRFDLSNFLNLYEFIYLYS